MNKVSYRYAQLRGWAVMGLLLLALSLLGGMIWRNFERLETMRAYVNYAHHIQQVAADIQASLTDYFITQNRQIQGQRLSRLTEEIFELATNDHHVAPETPGKLQELRATITEFTDARATPEQKEAHLLTALNITSSIMDVETLNREAMLEDISQSTRTEIALVFATTLCLLILVGFFLRYRILAPLNDLRKLLLRLAEEDYTPMAIQRIDPLLLPIFNSYNVMVSRLAELEEAKRHHAQSLEAEVRAATQALMEQQAGLARNERLAAVGELAAGIAHELRNPLAGIQMTCMNLRGEIVDSDQRHRVALVIDELKRMGRLLNELLDLSKHTPAPVTEFDLPVMVRELLALLRYQVPTGIELVMEGPPYLVCHLPESRIRQCLLNLVLNASQAMGAQPGKIKVVIHAESTDRVCLTVIDEGPGFSPQMLTTGIRPFVTGKTGGTGLGLAMVQRFVRELGGLMSLGANQPHGAQVRLVIPLKPP
ncbi:MAG: sensor histidine kinase [Methylococcus sp.]